MTAVPVILIINIDHHFPTVSYARSIPTIAFAHIFFAFAINSSIAAFFHSMSDCSYDPDLPPNISVTDAKRSLTTLAPTMTSDETNQMYSLIGFPSMV